MKKLILTAIILLPNFAKAELRFDFNFPEKQEKMIRQDMDFMKSLSGDTATPLHQQIFKSVTLSGKSYENYFNSRVNIFGFSECSDDAAVIACVNPLSDVNKMWITTHYTTFNMPQVYRVSVMIHEARHTEGAHDFYFHEKCPTPFLDESGKDVKGIFSGVKLEGQEACDNIVTGAYGVEAIFLKNIEKHCLNCNEKVRMDGRIYGDNLIIRIINPSAREALRRDFK